MSRVLLVGLNQKTCSTSAVLRMAHPPAASTAGLSLLRDLYQDSQSIPWVLMLKLHQKELNSGRGFFKEALVSLSFWKSDRCISV